MIKVRTATSADAEVIAEFNARMATETEGLTLDRDVLARGVRAVFERATGARYVVAEMEGRVVGQLMITEEWSDWRDGSIWWIQSVYVPAEFRGKGIFKTMYAHVAKLARENGVVGLRLYVEQENANAQKTYQRLGMVMTHYYVMEEML